MSDYCDRGIIERYASHLESLEMIEEATHVRDVFNTMGEKAGRGFNVFNDDLVKMAKNDIIIIKKIPFMGGANGWKMQEKRRLVL
jgi:hypothetical protein